MPANPTTDFATPDAGMPARPVTLFRADVMPTQTAAMWVTKHAAALSMWTPPEILLTAFGKSL
ncbi:hypothetical protein [Hornefia butyriciproducens]|uniref:hypothetical protein n=1 Tax=Hornefia butyriciproducens TaxID=2652293 RepID=UPI0023F07BB2|nr:hypothetical protein [Hornefia butyriciproducens]MDD6299625.1 hypothetical protein [Hornefia butyriciproducens]